MSAEADPITDELSELVFQVAGRLRGGFNAAAAELGLPPAQALLLANLSAPTPMRELAVWLSCEPSNVTGIVDGLERRGLVARRPYPADRRVKYVVLTEEGERGRAELRARSQAQARALFASLDADKEHLRDLLAAVVAGAPAPDEAQIPRR
ncbi:MarR family winged helix-turn-helix transcriptional regulator [Actinocorallia populi]|uniref:MarR family winged helix-turn-helix transcriptional regulator n=1 Tax=Actinocorallia populi TaxID=2079200 RepID=UPI000D08ACCD|nr:MarR family transcriptional regulator [Actinocorallia populi]